ncbi:dynein heavy chain, partial [Coemansia sp. RSA 921]
FSLGFFQSIFRQTIEHNKHLQNVTDARERLRILRRDLFVLAYSRACVSLHHDKQMALLVQLAQIKLRGDEEEDEFSQEAWARLNADLDFVMRDASAGSTEAVELSPELETLIGAEAREGLAVHAHALGWCRSWIKTLSSDGAEWVAFMQNAEPERCVPRSAVLADGSELAQMAAALALREFIVVRALRPDRVLAAAARFAAAVFGSAGQTLEQCGMVAEANLARVVSEETTPAMPIALCSVPGHDAAYRVDALAREQQRTVHAVAMGSIEGLALADQAIAVAAKTGSWVLLKNVHLAASWLGQLEKRLQTLRAPDGFRLFLTMEINPAVPPSLLRRARTLVFEPAPGIRANMLESLTSIPASTGPAELPRLRFMLAWLHSVVIERLRYAPLGWTTPYEFSDADFACALATVDCWVVRAAHGRANIDPARIPWTAIRTLLSECIYGGRIDSDFDHRVLRVFIDRWFCADAYNADFALVNDDCVVRGPDGTSHEEFVA